MVGIRDYVCLTKCRRRIGRWWKVFLCRFPVHVITSRAPPYMEGLPCTYGNSINDDDSEPDTYIRQTAVSYYMLKPVAVRRADHAFGHDLHSCTVSCTHVRLHEPTLTLYRMHSPIVRRMVRFCQLVRRSLSCILLRCKATLCCLSGKRKPGCFTECLPFAR